MPANKRQDRGAREARRRLRVYEARQTVQAERVRRRRRDNVIATIAGLVVLALATVAQVSYFTAGPGVPAPTPSASPSPSATPAATENVGDVPDAALAEDRAWNGTLELNDVKLAVRLDGKAAPQAVASFVTLADEGFYDGLSCHRLTNGGFFVLQCGDPEGTGGGGPGYSYGPVENAPDDDVYPAGTIAMARQGSAAYSQGSQFFLVYEDTTIPSDDAGGYTVLGRVTDGLEDLRSEITDAGVVDGAADGAPVVPTAITEVSVH